MDSNALSLHFRPIRDWPFEVKVNPEENIQLDIEALKKTTRGSCSHKHYVLASIYEELGVSVHYVTHPFHWHDLELDWPRRLRRLISKMPIQYHLALSIAPDGQRFLLDATWDSPLVRAGFRVNELNGHLSDTHLAILPCGPAIIHQTIAEREQYRQKLVGSLGQHTTVAEFYSELNTWLEQVRRTAE